jgi:hypothetical protein
MENLAMSVIALVGMLRYREHRSVPEIHQTLQGRSMPIAERTVLDLVQRYEELVTLRITDQEHLLSRLQDQGHVILALDGLQPDVGHEVLWVIRDCLSQEILLARPLLSQTLLPVPVHAVISDGAETIRSAVAFVFPGIPHQLCQFHYLKDATAPLYEADRHAKTELKKHLRGVRPIERALEANRTPENAAIRGYCLAVRASLTDDGRSPLDAPGLRLYERITQINDSMARIQEKKDYRHP